MILTTRLKEDNRIIKKSLKTYKIKSAEESLYKIKYLSKRVNDENNKIFIVASKQAIKSIKLNIKKGNLKNSIFFVIGKKTSLKLKKLGLNVKLVSQNSNELISKIKKNKNYKKNKFEYLCSNTFNKQFFLQLQKINENSTKNILYHLAPNKKFSKKTYILLKQRKIKMILFFSKFTCINFFKICRAHKLKRRNLNEIYFVTLSKDIGVLPCLKSHKVSWAERPQLTSILKKVKLTYK